LQNLILEDPAVKSHIAIRIRSEEKRFGENNLEFAEQDEIGYKSNIFVSGMKLKDAVGGLINGSAAAMNSEKGRTNESNGQI
jgi:hypothetical protein